MSIHDNEQKPSLHPFWHGKWIPVPKFKQSDDGEAPGEKEFSLREKSIKNPQKSVCSGIRRSLFRKCEIPLRICKSVRASFDTKLSAISIFCRIHFGHTANVNSAEAIV